MTERQQQPAASLLSVVASVGIFVGTALLSQWVQQQLFKKEQRQRSSSQRRRRQRQRQRSGHRGGSRQSPLQGQRVSRGLTPSGAPREWRGHWSRNENAFDHDEEDDEYDYDSEDFESEIQQYHLYMQQQQQQRMSMEEEEEDEYWRLARENYMRRRLEDRLSFHGEDEEDDEEEENEAPVSAPLSTATTETEDDNNNNARSPVGIPESFMPKNSNWNHFERCHGEVTRDSHHRISSTASSSLSVTSTTRISSQERDVVLEQQQQQQVFVDGSDEQHHVLRQSDSDEYSLEGEHAKSNHHHHHGGDAGGGGGGDRRNVGSGRDEDYDGSSSDDDSDVSLTSQLHFVWTEAHYHDKKPRHHHQSQQQQQRLPVIHSQRDFRLEDLHLETSNSAEISAAAASMSSPSAALEESGAAIRSSFSFNSSNTNSAATSRTPSPQPKPRPPSSSAKCGGQVLCPSLSTEERAGISSNRVQSRTAKSDLARGATISKVTLPGPPPAAFRSKSTSSPSSPKQHWKHGRSLQRCLSEPVFHQSKSSRRLTKQHSKRHPPSVSSTSNNPHREARANYNARIMPDKLVLVRHGQSLGNTDEQVYSTTPDNLVPLTELGWEQARAAGRRLRHQILNKSSSSTSRTKSPPPAQVHFIVSPYVRTVETFHGIVSAWCDPSEFDHITNRDARIKAWYSRLVEMGISWAEDPRIREQDFGNLQDPVKIKQSKQERHNFGAFYYRFGAGESAADVFDRMSTFLDSLWRSFDMNQSQYFVLVTHGISIRVLLSRYFRYTIDQFHLLSNPRNCEMVELEHDGKGRLRMAGRHELECQVRDRTRDCDEKDEAKEQVPEETSRPQQHHQQQQRHILRYRYHERLRVLPPEFVRTTHIRISHDDC